MNVARFLTLIKKYKKTAMGISFIILIVGGYNLFKKTSLPQFITVERKTLIEEVAVTGKTKAVKSVDLAFEKAGKIAWVGAEIGDKVFAGKILVQLDTSELSAQLKEAEAGVFGAQAKLDALVKGSRPESIAVKEAHYADTQKSVDDAFVTLTDAVRNGYTRADDAVRGKVDSFFVNPRSSSPSLNFNVSDSQLTINVTSGRVRTEEALTAWASLLTRLPSGDALLTLIPSLKTSLQVVSDFLDNVVLALNRANTIPSLSQSTIDGWRADASSARTTLATAITNLTNATEAVRSAESARAIAEKELTLERAGSTQEQIAEQQFQVKQTEARRDAIKAQLSKAILSAPFAGLVTKQDAKRGALANPQTVLVSLMSQNALNIEANVPEVDIGKIQVGNKVRITLDAFTGESFLGTISFIDPAETIVDGVVNFKVTIVFDTLDTRMKSGLTANLSIEVLKKENVLALPQVAIIETDMGIFVDKKEEKVIVRTPITTGIRTEDGFVEIRSGLNEGDKVLNVGIKLPS